MPRHRTREFTAMTVLAINRRESLLFWLCACVFLFFYLGATTPWQSEDRWLQVALEMVESGNYFLPTINGTVYFDKPLLGYWLVVLFGPFTGGINEWSLRLPSAFAAL